MMENTTQKSFGNNQLKKVLGIGFGIAILIGGTIGVGILRTTGSIAQLLDNYWLIIACWVFGGVYVILAAGSYAELATMMPKAGGAYNYAKRAFGNYAGFITGWFDYILNGIAPAFFCIVIAEYLTILVPTFKNYQTIISIAFLLAFTLLHISGTKNGSIFQQITSVIKVIFFVALIVACFMFTGTTLHSNPPNTALVKTSMLIAFLKALQLVIGTYQGWNSVCFFAEEDKNPNKNIPKSLYTGALIVLCIYVLINMAFFHVLPISSIANSKLAASDVSRIVFGDTGAIFVTVISIFSAISILNAYMMIPARILFGLSRDGYFIKQGATVNKAGTPINALLISSFLSLVLIIIGSFEDLFSLASFMGVFVLGMSFASLIKLRLKEPTLARPYSSWGYPYTSIIVMIITIAIFIGFAISDTKNLIIILIIGLLSYPFYIGLFKNKIQ